MNISNKGLGAVSAFILLLGSLLWLHLPHLVGTIKSRARQKIGNLSFGKEPKDGSQA